MIIIFQEEILRKIDSSLIKKSMNLNYIAKDLTVNMNVVYIKFINVNSG